MSQDSANLADGTPEEAGNSLQELMRKRRERTAKERAEALAKLPAEGVYFDPLQAAYLRQFLRQMASQTNLQMAAMHLPIEAKLEPYELDRLPLPDASEVLHPDLLFGTGYGPNGKGV